MTPDTRRLRTASRIAYAALSAACAMMPLESAAYDTSAAGPTFTASEVRKILSHGPWPAPALPDPTNRVSDKPDAIEFGTRLFFDQRLSGKGEVSCATCHVPERNWTDNLRRGIGAASGRQK